MQGHLVRVCRLKCLRNSWLAVESYLDAGFCEDEGGEFRRADVSIANGKEPYSVRQYT